MKLAESDYICTSTHLTQIRKKTTALRFTCGGTTAMLSLWGKGEAVTPLRIVEGGVAEELKVDGGVFEGGDSLLGGCTISDASAADNSSSVGACCMLYPCAANTNMQSRHFISPATGAAMQVAAPNPNGHPLNRAFLCLSEKIAQCLRSQRLGRCPVRV